MKYILLLFSLLLFAGCTPKSKKKPIHSKIPKEVIVPQSCDTIVLQDINNDRIIDTAFVLTPATIEVRDKNGDLEYVSNCVDNNCFNSIRFSCGLPELFYKDSVWGRVENIGDLNKDGICELIFCPSWFSPSSRI